MYLGLIYIVSDTDNTHSNKVRKAIYLFYSVLFHDFNGFLLCILLVKKRLADNQSRSVSKTSLNASLHGFSGIGNHMYTRLHGCNCNSY